MCIFVDDAEYSSLNWTFIDPNSTFVETQAECDALNLNDLEVLKEIEVYPNPVSDILNVKTSDGSEINKVILYNCLGEEILETKNTNFNLSELTNGVYFLKVYTIDLEMFIRKIIKKGL